MQEGGGGRVTFMDAAMSSYRSACSASLAWLTASSRDMAAIASTVRENERGATNEARGGQKKLSRRLSGR